jgi:membrane protein CcdC involved in cytochrome C biogenesis
MVSCDDGREGFVPNYGRYLVSALWTLLLLITQVRLITIKYSRTIRYNKLTLLPYYFLATTAVMGQLQVFLTHEYGCREGFLEFT